MKQFKRSDRVAEMIQRELSELIQLHVKDPRLPAFITVSAVHVSKDMSHAKVFITLLQGDKEVAVKVLNHAAPFLRSSLGKLMKLRIVPQLHFVYDESIEYGIRLGKLIDEANRDIPSDDAAADEQE